MKTSRPQVLFIVGPTATHKSSVAYSVAEKYQAHILSADSRQVYKGLEITSGADIPENYSRVQGDPFDYWQSSDERKLFGLSLIEPTESWSVGQFQVYFSDCLKVCQQENKNLIVVGGSGLYSHAFQITDPNLHTQPNYDMRARLETKSLQELQTEILHLHSTHQIQSNPSDWMNPRRLIRAIEIELAKTRSSADLPPDHPTSALLPANTHWVGLTATIESIEQRIRERVKTRIQHGAIQEVERLLFSYPDQKLPAFSATGVKEVQLFLTDQISKEQLIELWTIRERQYAKRQMTWFKKREYIDWIQIEDKTVPEIIEKIS